MEKTLLGVSVIALAVFAATEVHGAGSYNLGAFRKAASGGCSSGGYGYNGYCYYLGSAGNSCITTCSSLGGCLLSPTQTVASTQAICSSVLTGLGASYSGYSGGSNSYAYACALKGTTYYYDNSASSFVTCSATNTSTKRVCACGAGGLTQTGAATINGYNYILGASGASCATACSSNGGCVLAGDQYAATSASICTSILLNLGYSTSGSGTSTTAYGCGYSSSFGGSSELGASPTNCTVTQSGVQLVCACANP